MITDKGIIISVEDHGRAVLIQKDITIGTTVMLHPGPVILIQDGDVPKLNRNMYVALSTLKNSFEQGVTGEDTQKLIQFINKTLTEIESDPDLVEQVKE